MKKLVYLLLALMMGFSAFAQKKEVKAAEKALKKGDIELAQENIQKACELKDNADAKTKARIYFTKAKIAEAQGDLETAVKMFVKVKDFEKENGFTKYSGDAEKELMTLGNQLLKRVSAANDAKNFAEAEKNMKLVYLISPNDDNLYILGVLQLYNNNFEEAYKNFKQLYDKGYTGVKTQYLLTDTKTGQTVAAPDEKTMKIMAKTDQYTNPRVEKTESKRAELVANMLYALSKMGKDDEAFQLAKKAEAEDPNNVSLIVGEANYYLKKNDHKNFVQTMERAFQLDPQPQYAYNIGFGYYSMKDYDNARKWFKKALELKPDYKDAVLALSLVELAPEKELVEKINNSLSSPKKYEAYMEELKAVYRKALPYLEKYHELEPNDEKNIRTLKKIYTQLGMRDKANEMKALLKRM
ncbi:MAG: tetratricopeptide repeat protein [Chlorobi bacterium]|nr:tetratricopeptide repeat protein [Chlorobiota bacterium]